MNGLIRVFFVMLIRDPAEIGRVMGGVKSGILGGAMVCEMNVVGCEIADQCNRECDPYNDPNSV